MDGVDAFVGRSREIVAFESLLSQPQRLLELWGVPGIGKSTLLQMLAARAEAEGFRPATIDLKMVHDWDDEPLERLVEKLADAFTGALSKPGSWRFARHRRQFDRQRAQAVTTLRDRLSPNGGAFRMTADRGGSISNTVVHIDSPTSDVRGAHRQYRRDLISALTDQLVGGRDFSSAVLFFDSTEVLRWLGQRSWFPDAEATDRPVRGRWFITDVIEPIMRAAAGLKVVLAGYDEVPLSPDLARQAVTSIELREWTVAETSEYLRLRGLGEQVLSAAEVHRSCRGIPLWTSLLAEACRAEVSRGDRPDRALLERLAEGLPAEQWLSQEFLARLGPRRARIVTAAAIPRTVTRDVVAVLLADQVPDLPPEWFDDLCGYSFIRTSAGGAAGTRRHMHELIRAAIHAKLRRDSRDRLSELHGQVAAYYATRTGGLLERLYHQFGSGDLLRAAQTWDAEVAAALLRHQFDRAMRYIEVVTAPEQLELLRDDLLVARARHYHAHIAAFQDNLVEAKALAAEARERFLGAGDAIGAAEAARLSGEVASRLGDVGEANTHFRDAVRDFERGADPIGKTAAITLIAGEALRIGDIKTAGYHFRKALDGTNSHGRANATRGLADVAARQDEHEPARSLYTEAVDLFRVESDDLGVANAQLALGELELRDAMRTALPIGSLERAERAIDAAAATFDQLKDRLGLSNTFRARGDLAMARGRRDDARTLYGRAFGLAQESGSALAEANARLALGDVALRARDLVAAAEHLDQALRIFTALREPLGAANTRHRLGRLATLRKEPVAAEHHYDDALAAHRTLFDRSGAADDLEALAALALAAEDRMLALDRYRQAMLLRRAVGDLRRQAEIGEAIKKLTSDQEGRST